MRDDAGQLCGLHDADDLPATLPSVLLARSLDPVSYTHLTLPTSDLV